MALKGGDVGWGRKEGGPYVGKGCDTLVPAVGKLCVGARGTSSRGK